MKYLFLFLTVILILVSLIACNKPENPEKPETFTFKTNINDYDENLTLKLGDEITVTAEIINNTNKKQTILHGEQPIFLYVGEYDTLYGYSDIAFYTDVKPKEIIKKELSYKADKAGKYVIILHSDFSYGNKKGVYDINVKNDKKIIVEVVE